MSRRTLIFIFIWAIAFAIALLLDFPVAQWVHTSGTGKFVEGKWWAQIPKEPGQFRFTVAVAVLLGILRKIRWKQVVFVILASVISGAHVLIKWMVGRSRPYKLPGPVQPRPFELHPLRDGLYGLFHQTNLSFPSGHVCPASALAASMFLLWPAGSWIFLLLAVMVGIERIAENAHYCSDVIGAVGFGVLETVLLYRMLSSWMSSPQRGAL